LFVILPTEKDDGEYKLSTGSGNEEWKVYAWLSANIEVTTSGASKAGDHC